MIYKGCLYGFLGITKFYILVSKNDNFKISIYVKSGVGVNKYSNRKRFSELV